MSIYPAVQGSDRMVLTDMRGSGRIEATRTDQGLQVVFRYGGTTLTYQADERFLDIDPSQHGSCRALVKEGRKTDLLRA